MTNEPSSKSNLERKACCACSGERASPAPLCAPGCTTCEICAGARRRSSTCQRAVVAGEAGRVGDARARACTYKLES